MYPTKHHPNNSRQPQIVAVAAVYDTEAEFGHWCFYGGPHVVGYGTSYDAGKVGAYIDAIAAVLTATSGSSEPLVIFPFDQLHSFWSTWQLQADTTKEDASVDAQDLFKPISRCEGERTWTLMENGAHHWYELVVEQMIRPMTGQKSRRSSSRVEPPGHLTNV